MADIEMGWCDEPVEAVGAASAVTLTCDLCGKTPSQDEHILLQRFEWGLWSKERTPEPTTSLMIKGEKETVHMSRSFVEQGKCTNQENNCETPWASYLKTKVRRGESGQQPRGPACRDCAMVSSRSFPGMSFEQLVLAERLSRGELKSEPWIPEGLDEDTRMGVLIKKNLLFVSKEEFQESNGAPLPADTNTEKIIDETGKEVEGIFVLDPAKPHRTVEVFRATGIVLHKHLAGPSAMLRPSQNSELMNHVLQQDKKKLSKAFSSPLSKNEYLQLGEKAKAAPVPTADIKDPDPAPLASPQRPREGDDDGEAESPEEVQELDEVGASAATLRLQEDSTSAGKSKGKKGKKGGRGKGKGGRRGVAAGADATKRRRLDGRGAGYASQGGNDLEAGRTSHAGGSDGSGSAPAAASSMRSSSPRRSSYGSRNSPSQKLAGSALKCIEELTVGDALCGRLLGQTKYQARRVITAFETASMADAVECMMCIQLKAHLSFIERCETMSTTSGLTSVPASERYGFIDEIFLREANVPAQFLLNCVFAKVKEQKLDVPAEIEEWMRIIQPFDFASVDGEGAFNHCTHVFKLLIV
eukprot:31310-Amphidinium_carterae.1